MTFNQAQKDAASLGFQLYRGTKRRCDGYSAVSNDGAQHLVGRTLALIMPRIRDAAGLIEAEDDRG